MRSAAERRHALKTATFTPHAHGAKSIGSANGSFQIVTDLGDIWQMVVMNSRKAVDCVRGERIRPANTRRMKKTAGETAQDIRGDRLRSTLEEKRKWHQFKYGG